jgi:hypothetical protein
LLSCRAENAEGSEHCFKCGHGLYVLVEGSLLAGRYKIVAPLGGMGIVYKAHDRELDEFVAITPRPDLRGACPTV